MPTGAFLVLFIVKISPDPNLDESRSDVAASAKSKTESHPKRVAHSVFPHLQLSCKFSCIASRCVATVRNTVLKQRARATLSVSHIQVYPNYNYHVEWGYVCE